MTYRHVLFFSVVFLGTAITKAQDDQRTQITYDLTTEAAVGTGDYTAYQLVTNRHHVLSTRPNTAYLRGAINARHAFTDDLVLSGTIDAIGSVHADHKAYLQQCYANLSYQDFFVEFGTKEEKQVVRDDLLSVGSFVKGTNAKPFLQAHLGTNDFWTVPFTKGWIQVHFDAGYGKFLDGNYREDAFYKGVTPSGGNVNYKYATGIWLHQKHLYIRTNPEKRFFAMAGIEHMVQFGGTKYMYVKNADGSETLQSKSKPADLKAMCPAANVASMFVVNNAFGRKATIVYLLSIIGGAMGFGLLVDYWPGLRDVFVNALPCHVMHHGMHGASWFNTVCSVFLLSMIVVAIGAKYWKSYQIKKNKTTAMKEFKVKGMMCAHCKANVEKGLAALPGVEKVTVDLAKGTALVEGFVPDQLIIDCIEDLGYEYVP